MPGMKFVSILVPEAYLQIIHDLVRQGVFPNRSEAIRAAIRDLINKDEKIAEWMAKKAQKDEGLKEVMERLAKSEAKRLG